jgi:hypothetical protein
MLYARVVLAFEEVEVGDQVSGEELSSVGSGPEVGVFEPELVISSEQGNPGAFKPYLEFYKSLLFILWFTALSN